MNVALNKKIARMAVEHTLRGNSPPHKKPMKAANWDYYRRSPRSFERTRNPRDINEVDKCVISLRSQWKKVKPKSSDGLATIRQLARLARAKGCGNCEDMASVAFDYCYTMGARPLELMNLVGTSHAFVCIGRSGKSELGKPRTWGADSYICDPWGAGLKGNDIYGLYPGKDFVQGMSRVAPSFTGLQVVFRVN
jgi:hypothetical protein